MSMPSVPPPVRRTRSGGSATDAGPSGLSAPPPVSLAGPSGANPFLPAEVGIFWDYENVPLPSDALVASAASGRLSDFARTMGPVVEMRLYHDSEKDAPVRKQHRASLEQLGYTIVDCPTSRKKEAVDKKIIVDSMMFAVTRSARQQPCSVLLVSGDGDFAHMLSRLKGVGVHTCAVLPARSSRELPAVCHQTLDWERDFLQRASRPKTPTSAKPGKQLRVTLPPGVKSPAGAKPASARTRPKGGGAKSPAVNRANALKSPIAKKPKAAQKRGRPSPARGRGSKSPARGSKSKRAK